MNENEYYFPLLKNKIFFQNKGFATINRFSDFNQKYLKADSSKNTLALNPLLKSSHKRFNSYLPFCNTDKFNSIKNSKNLIKENEDYENRHQKTAEIYFSTLKHIKGKF